ncbi:MAG: glycosyltransferase family 4 protein [Paludibacter sp.]|nr:glycosyltransferase family 4 protein [Paludibacter sp.]
MKIIIDNIIFSLQKGGGVSVVWKEIILRILKSDFSIFFVEYKGAEKNIFRKMIDIDNEKIIKKSSFLLFIKRYFNLHSKEKFPFIFHSSYYRYSKDKQAINITTVHDFTYEYYYRGFQKWLHCRQKYAAIKNSDCIICVSQSTKNDLLKFLPKTDPAKIHVIYNGVSDEYYDISKEEADESVSIYGNYALFVGFRSGYKNFENAVLSVKNTNLNLVIVGGELTKNEKAFLEKELGENRFFALTRIPSSELNKLYAGAYCLLYLSLYEGFGIPVLEAQKSGCPIITLNASSVVEIIGNQQLVVKKNTVDEIVEKINLLKNSQLRHHIIEAGFQNAKKYTWDNMYRQVSKLYENIILENRKNEN